MKKLYCLTILLALLLSTNCFSGKRKYHQYSGQEAFVSAAKKHQDCSFFAYVRGIPTFFVHMLWHEGKRLVNGDLLREGSYDKCCLGHDCHKTDKKTTVKDVDSQEWEEKFDARFFMGTPWYDLSKCVKECGYCEKYPLGFCQWRKKLQSVHYQMHGHLVVLQERKNKDWNHLFSVWNEHKEDAVHHHKFHELVELVKKNHFVSGNAKIVKRDNYYLYQSEYQDTITIPASFYTEKMRQKAIEEAFYSFEKYYISDKCTYCQEVKKKEEKDKREKLRKKLKEQEKKRRQRKAQKQKEQKGRESREKSRGKKRRSRYKEWKKKYDRQSSCNYAFDSGSSDSSDFSDFSFDYDTSENRYKNREESKEQSKHNEGFRFSYQESYSGSNFQDNFNNHEENCFSQGTRKKRKLSSKEDDEKRKDKAIEQKLKGYAPTPRGLAYKLLGLSIGSGITQRHIKKAYRKLSMKYHPDQNKASDAKDMFQVINAAYSLLKPSSNESEQDFFRTMKQSHLIVTKLIELQ